MVTAWGDESQSVWALDPGAYILAAAVTPGGDLDPLRQAMTRLLTPFARKVHWRADSEAQHQKVIDCIAQLPLSGLVVVRCAPGDSSERSRRKCLETLLAELHALGCTSLTLESRGRADDQRDVAMTRYLQRQRSLGGEVRLFHEVGPKEPLLWIADALCGAVVEDRCGKPANLARLAQHITVSLIESYT